MFDNLEKNLIEVIREAQLKLGYEEREVSFNYPISSLNGLLGTDCDFDGMKLKLEEFSNHEKCGKLGEISIGKGTDEGIFCITVSAEGVRYVHENTDENGFLAEFISFMGSHCHDFDEVKKLFLKYSTEDNLFVEKIDDDEFDYLVYFKNGEPDNFRYCFAEEFGHITYHRFSKYDWEILQG